MQYTIIIEQGVDGYLLVDVLELAGCRTQAKSYDELFERLKEVVTLYKEVNQDKLESEDIPKFVGVQQLTF